MRVSSLAVVVVIVALLSPSAWAKHYSFVGGYPASGVTAERAKSLERGGVSVKTGAKTASRTGQGRVKITVTTNVVTRTGTRPAKGSSGVKSSDATKSSATAKSSKQKR